MSFWRVFRQISKASISLLGHLRVYIFQFKILTHVVGFGASGVIDHMMSVNHKLKNTNSPWISSQHIFMTVTTKMGRLIHICLQYIYRNVYLDGTNYSNAKQLFVMVIVLAIQNTSHEKQI